MTDTTDNISTSDEMEMDQQMVMACQQGDTETVQQLLDAGFDCHKPLEWRDRENEAFTTPAMFIAIDYHQIDVVRLLLLAKGNSTNVNMKDSNDYSPLTWACMNGNVSLAQVLLDHGSTVDQDAMDMAQEQGHTELLTLLQPHFDWYAHIDANDVDEIMMQASRQGDVPKVQELIAQGYNFDKWKNQEGSYQPDSPIYVALKNGHIQVIQEFLQAGVEAHLEETHFHHDVIPEEDEDEDNDNDNDNDEAAPTTNNHPSTELTAEQIEAISAQFLAADQQEQEQEQEQS